MRHRNRAAWHGVVEGVLAKRKRSVGSSRSFAHADCPAAIMGLAANLRRHLADARDCLNAREVDSDVSGRASDALTCERARKVAT